MKIYCAACGELIDFRLAWCDLLTSTKICGKQCLDKIRNDYAKVILGNEEVKHE